MALILSSGIVGAITVSATISSTPTAYVSPYSCEKGVDFIITHDNAPALNYYAIATSGQPTVPCGMLWAGGPNNIGGLSGTNGSAELQGAINFLKPSCGTIMIVGNITLTHGITLYACETLTGWAGSGVHGASNAEASGLHSLDKTRPVITVAANTATTPTSNYFPVIQHLTIVGAGQASGVKQQGIALSGTTLLDMKITDVNVFNVGGNCVYTAGNAGLKLWIDKFYGENCGESGGNFTSGENFIEGNSYFFGNTRDGIYTSTSVTMTGGWINTNTLYGIQCEFFNNIPGCTFTGTLVTTNGGSTKSQVIIRGISTGNIVNAIFTGDTFYSTTATSQLQSGGYAHASFVSNLFGGGIPVLSAPNGFSIGTTWNMWNNIGYNPIGKVTTNFLIGGRSGVTAHTIGPGLSGNSTTEVTGVTYTVSYADQYITSADSSNADNAILIKDAAGNTVFGPVHTLTAQFIPAGFTITWGAFTGTAGAVIDVGS